MSGANLPTWKIPGCNSHRRLHRLERLLPEIRAFLFERLRLELHPGKISIQTIASGVDFLGWVHFEKCRVLRTVTKRRMFKSLEESSNSSVVQSYLGLIRHGSGHKLKETIERLGYIVWTRVG